jgi:hypothetical protein
MKDKKFTFTEALGMDKEHFAKACETWFGNRAYNSVMGNPEDRELSNYNAQVFGKVLRERLI